MKKTRNFIPILIWIAVMFGGSIFEVLGGGLSVFASGDQSSVTRDTSMQTTSVSTQITVGEDQSYSVDETITVDFNDYRHGIYRYIPEKGIAMSMEDGELKKVPYKADVTLQSANVNVSESEENGNAVFQMGDADQTVYGENTYQIAYVFTPSFQDSDYRNAYYNVFPTQWQNEIPAGSRFTIRFPKDFNHDILKFYYGSYGENNDASDVISYTWDQNTVTGTLNQDLALGEGMTFYAPMEEGYFTSVHQVQGVEWILLIPAILIFVLILILFLMFGRDDTIIPSIQYQPPADLDSASVGYVIDGSIEDKDLISLIIYWADKGYITMSETAEGELVLHKKKELAPNAPNYQHTIFAGIFEGFTDRSIENLKYKFDGTLAMAKDQLNFFFRKDNKDMIYTASSKAARIISMILCTLPMLWFILYTSILSATSTFRFILQIVLWAALFAGSIAFGHIIDKWYATSAAKRKTQAVMSLTICFLSTALFAGMYVARVMRHEIFNYIWVLAVVVVLTCIMVVLTGFMKKRTEQCIEWMGRLAGLRDFIETAELDRMNELANGNPEWFYHIIPYAYVFGLSDVFAKKLKDLSLAAPDWYQPHNQYTFFDYYLFNRCMNQSLSHTVTTLTVPQPSTTSGSGGFGGGGGFSGGGFSGGGFGGGGGGSW